ncbi:S16 family serine protease [Psychrobacillus sp. NPDC096623]|uniref:S16 family serine protease n=1 Tax=Psychrobacillus sp. NPDC096623 TaxID=3364492 RepID=UPI003803F155
MKKIFDLVNKHQMLPFVMTIFVYFAELYLYLLDYISSFFFCNILALLVLFWPLFLLAIRKTQISKYIFLLSFIASLFLLVYEFPLISTDGSRYFVSSYVSPEELIKNSGIYILAVRSTEILLAEDLDGQDFRNLNNQLLIFDIEPASNFHRYAGKTTAIFKLVGINMEYDYFQQMSVNVKSYLNTSNPNIDEFLSRNNSGGNSAGLALVLSSLIEQGKFKNDIPIGVTGAISKSGKAIEIGLTKEKILSANKIGLSYIILPIGNLAEANDVVKSLKLPIKVIGVRNVDEAIEQINELNKDPE